MSYRWLDRNLKWVFTLPSVIFVVLMMAFPIFYTIWISFHEWSMSSVVAPKWVGGENYATLFKDARFWNSVEVTVVFTLSTVVLQTVLGVAVALLFFRKIRGKSIARTLMLLPMVATPVAMGLVWQLIYEPTIGSANELLKMFGLKPMDWLASPSQAMMSLVIIDVWEWTPMIALIVMAGLATLPSEPYEAADVDGANGFQKFRYITLPLLIPTILAAGLLRLIDSLKTFDIIYATTQGGPNYASETLNLYGYVLGFQYFKLGLASALIVVFFLIVFSLILAVLGIRKRMEGLHR